MTHLNKLLLIPIVAGSLVLTGCGGGEAPNGHEGHDHEKHLESGGHDDDDKRGSDEHGAEQQLSKVTIGGSVFDVSLGGEPRPNVTLHIDIKLESGPSPAAIRVWVGNESATGSVKGKAVGSKGDYHADAACPPDFDDDDALWIEVESTDGTRTTESMALKHHDK